MSDQGQVFVVTDPAEGPKAFRVQTRVTSRGEMAVILMGVDCAERVMCHESVSFILAEGEFVFKVDPSTVGILDQLLQQGALRIERVFDMGGGRPAPCCVLTPGGAPQPAYEGTTGRAGASAHAAAEVAASAASDRSFFDSLLPGNTSSRGQDGDDSDLMIPPGMMPPGMVRNNSETLSGAFGGGGGGGSGGGGGVGAMGDIMAMLQQGNGSTGGNLSGMGGRNNFPMPTPTPTVPAVARHLMPRTTRGSTGGGARIRGGGEGSADDGFFDASAGARARRPTPLPVSLLQPDGSRGAAGAGGTGVYYAGPSGPGSSLSSLDGSGIFGRTSIGGMPSVFGAPPSAASGSSSPAPICAPFSTLFSGGGGRLGRVGLGPPPGMGPPMPGSNLVSSHSPSGGVGAASGNGEGNGAGNGGGSAVGGAGADSNFDIMGMLASASANDTSKAAGDYPPWFTERQVRAHSEAAVYLASIGMKPPRMGPRVPGNLRAVPSVVAVPRVRPPMPPAVPPMPPMPPMLSSGPGAMLSAADLEARAMGGVFGDSPAPPASAGGGRVDLMGMLGAAAAVKGAQGGDSGVDLMGMLASASANVGASAMPPMPPMPASGRFVHDLDDDASADGMNSALDLGFMGITSVVVAAESFTETGQTQKSTTGAPAAIPVRDDKKDKKAEKKEKDKKLKKGEPRDPGAWPWSIGMEHRAKERMEVEAGAEQQTAAALAAAVKQGLGGERLEKVVGKKSAFETTSQLQAPLPEDNVGRQMMRKQGWAPLVDPATGGVVDEAPVPIPDLGFSARAGLGSVERLPRGPATATDEADGLHKQARVLAMVGEAKGTLSRPSSIGKLRASVSAGGVSAGSGSGSGGSRLGLNGGIGDSDAEDEEDWAKEEDKAIDGRDKMAEERDAHAQEDATSSADADARSKSAAESVRVGAGVKQDQAAAAATAMDDDDGAVDSWEEMASPSPAPEKKTVGAGEREEAKEETDEEETDEAAKGGAEIVDVTAVDVGESAVTTACASGSSASGDHLTDAELDAETADLLEKQGEKVEEQVVKVQLRSEGGRWKAQVLPPPPPPNTVSAASPTAVAPPAFVVGVRHEEVDGGDDDESRQEGAGAATAAAVAEIVPTHTYSAEALRRINAGCDAMPPGFNQDTLQLFEFADKGKATAKERADKEKESERVRADKAEKAKALKRAEKEAQAVARKAAREEGPSLGGALGLGFLEFNVAVDQSESQADSTPNDEPEFGTPSEPGPELEPVAPKVEAGTEQPEMSSESEEPSQEEKVSAAEMASAMVVEQAAADEATAAAADEATAATTAALAVAEAAADEAAAAAATAKASAPTAAVAAAGTVAETGTGAMATAVVASAGVGMSVGALAAALMAELRGLEDRVEVLGGEVFGGEHGEELLVALKLSAALQAIRLEPFKSI